MKELNLNVSFLVEKNAITSVLLEKGNGGFQFQVKGRGISQSLVREMTDWMDGYREGVFIPPPFSLMWPVFPTFTQRVLEILPTIPAGEVRSYGAVAKEVGNSRASRAVGSACGKNPFPLIVPCHRVIASSGTLGGFALENAIKEELLRHEGVVIKNPSDSLLCFNE